MHKIAIKVSALTLSLSLFLSSSALLAVAPIETQYFTLEEIRNQCELYSSEVLQGKSSLNIAEAERFKAEIDSYDVRWTVISTPYLPAATADGYMKQAEVALDNAIQGKSDAEDALEEARKKAGFNGETRYFGLLQMDQTMETLKKTLALQERLLGIERLKVSLGLGTMVEVNQQAIKVSELRSNLKQLEMGRALATKELLRQMGKPEGTRFELVPLDQTYPETPLAFELAALTEKAKANSLTLKQLNRAIENLDDMIDEGGMTIPQRDVLAAQTENIKLNRDEFLYTIGLVAQNSLDELERLDLKIALLWTQLEKAQQDFNHTKLRVDLGLAPAISLPGAELALINAQNEYQKALDDRYLMRRSVHLLELGVMTGPGQS